MRHNRQFGDAVMTVPHRPVPPFASALVAAANEGHARIDRDFLKQARIPHLRTATSGAEALKILRRDNLELVLCDTTLADMTGQEFVTAMRADAALARTQVIMAAANPARADVIRAVSLGAAGFLLRPYSQLVFTRHLALARHMASFGASGRKLLDRAKLAEATGDTAAALRQFTSVADGPDAAPRLFEEGMAALAGKNLDGAIGAFHKALELNALYVEAYLGLARAWHAKGSLRQYRYFMKQAAATCARARRFEELRDRFVELLARDEAGYNPFLALANELLVDRRYTAAVALFRQAQSLAPDNTAIELGLAKAYHFLREPQLARKALEKCLEANTTEDPEVQALYHRLTGRRLGDLPTMEEVSRPQSEPVHYPWLLRGVLYMAGWATDSLLRARRPARAA